MATFIDKVLKWLRGDYREKSYEDAWRASNPDSEYSLFGGEYSNGKPAAPNTGGALGYLGELIRSLTAYYARTELTGAEREANEFSAGEAQKSRDFTEYMARNKYSIETQSMQDAGVNPAMVYGGGSLVPTAANGAQASSVAPTGGDFGTAIMSLVRMPLELKKLEKETKLVDQQIAESETRADKNRAETKGQELQNDITEETKTAVVSALNMSPQERAATIANIRSNTQNTIIRNRLTAVEILQQNLSYKQNLRMNDLLFEFQQLQNAAQSTDNKYQAKTLQANLNRISAEIGMLNAQAQLHMSNVQRNTFLNALSVGQTTLANEQAATERWKQSDIKAGIPLKQYDPKAHLTRAVVAPADWAHNQMVNYFDMWRSNWNSFRRQTEQRNNAMWLSEAYATYGEQVSAANNRDY